MRQREYFINLEATWLPHIHGQARMADQQPRKSLQSKVAEANDKIEISFGKTSQD